MSKHEFYYRFEPLGIDSSSRKDVERHSRKLSSFSDLSKQLEKLRTAFESASKERADIAINVFPDVFGLTELCVFHKIKRKFLSKAIKKQCFVLVVTKFVELNDELNMLEYETESFSEVYKILKQLIEDHLLPDFSVWKRIL